MLWGHCQDEVGLFHQLRGEEARLMATDIEASLARDAAGVFVCGASYRGMGIPACVQQANSTAQVIANYLTAVRN